MLCYVLLNYERVCCWWTVKECVQRRREREYIRSERNKSNKVEATGESEWEWEWVRRVRRFGLVADERSKCTYFVRARVEEKRRVVCELQECRCRWRRRWAEFRSRRARRTSCRAPRWATWTSLAGAPTRLRATERTHNITSELQLNCKGSTNRMSTIDPVPPGHRYSNTISTLTLLLQDNNTKYSIRSACSVYSVIWVRSARRVCKLIRAKSPRQS